MPETIKKLEVLAPAGDRERLLAAILYGADAVYLGGNQFGMRAAAASFDFDALKDAVTYAHQRGVQVFLTCNTLPRNQEMEMLPEFLRLAAACGVDALIVSDIGVLDMAKRTLPEMEIHISTQAGIVNYASASAFYQMGAKRVVLARELSLDEIKEIRDKTPPDLEIEVFVHGAMCVSVSGRCLLSNYLTGRDANRGACAQPCRWGYYLMEEKRPGQYFPIFEDEQGTHILNAKDLCMIEHIDKLAEAGVTSLKIEGRAKSSYYVSVVTNAYRCAVDHYYASPADALPQWILDEVKKVSHRQYSTGFFFGVPEEGQYYENGGYLRSYDVVAVADGWEDGMLTVTQRNKFVVGDQLEVLEPSSPPFFLTVSEIIDLEGGSLPDACHPMAQYRLPMSKAVAKGAILRRQSKE